MRSIAAIIFVLFPSNIRQERWVASSSAAVCLGERFFVGSPAGSESTSIILSEGLVDKSDAISVSEDDSEAIVPPSVGESVAVDVDEDPAATGFADVFMVTTSNPEHTRHHEQMLRR